MDNYKDMEPMFQRRCANYVYVIPDGLRELMTDISREVLREQPEHLCHFITSYLEALMITRENARVAAKTVSHLADAGEVITQLLARTNMTRKQANKTCTIIQKAFRKHMRHRRRHEAVEREPLLQKIIQKAKTTYAQAESAVCIIQKAYRTFRLRRQLEYRQDVVDWRAAFYNTMGIYRKTGVTSAEANRAATLIKAAYKGYYTRRVMHKLRGIVKKPREPIKGYIKEGEEKEIRVHVTDSWTVKDSPSFIETRAAKIIQRAFRNYQKYKKDMDRSSYESGMSKLPTLSTTGAMQDYTYQSVPPIQEEQEVYIETDEFEAMCEEIQIAAYMDDTLERASTQKDETEPASNTLTSMYTAVEFEYNTDE